jgi:hypothetical protein
MTATKIAGEGHLMPVLVRDNQRVEKNKDKGENVEGLSTVVVHSQ